MYFKAANSDGEGALENGLQEEQLRAKRRSHPAVLRRRRVQAGELAVEHREPSPSRRWNRVHGAVLPPSQQGRIFSPSRNSPENYTSKVFSTHPEGKDIWPKAGAMERLLNAVTIKIENVGSQKRSRNILVRT